MTILRGLRALTHRFSAVDGPTSLSVGAPLPSLWPPDGASTPEWWESGVAASREYDNPALPHRPWFDDGRGFVSKALYRDHLFLGCATGRRFVWQQRAVPKSYMAQGGIGQYDFEKYREWEPEGPFPLYLHESILDGHAYICGGTGFGKTAGVIMPLIIQLIRGAANRDGSRTPCQPLVFLDMKGEEALVHTAGAEALARGQTFKVFDLRPGKPTHRFNGFGGVGAGRRSVSQICQLLLDALGLNHGAGYGFGYYTERSRFALALAIKLDPHVRSFAALEDNLRRALRNERDKKARSDAFELLSRIQNLAEYDQLVTSADDDANNRDGIIYMPDVLKNREIVYFWLPAALESISADMVAKLVLSNLRTAAADHLEQYPDDPVKITLVIDELQRVVGENLAGILREARSFGIRTILCNQSLEELKLPSRFDLAPTVLANTRVKFFATTPTEGEYYVFIERGCGATHPKPYPTRTNPLLRKLAVEEFAYTVRSQWPLSGKVYRERATKALPGWDEIPGGNWRKKRQVETVLPQIAAAPPEVMDDESRPHSVPLAIDVHDQLRDEQMAFIAALFSAPAAVDATAPSA